MQDNVALKRKTEAWQRIINKLPTDTHTHTHPFNGPLSGTTRVSLYLKGKTSLDFTEPRYSEWRWHQLGHMQVCTSLQTDNHASTLPLSFFQAGCPSCHPTNSVKALKAKVNTLLLCPRVYNRGVLGSSSYYWRFCPVLANCAATSSWLHWHRKSDEWLENGTLAWAAS